MTEVTVRATTRSGSTSTVIVDVAQIAAGFLEWRDGFLALRDGFLVMRDGFLAWRDGFLEWINGFQALRDAFLT